MSWNKEVVTQKDDKVKSPLQAASNPQLKGKFCFYARSQN